MVEVYGPGDPGKVIGHMDVRLPHPSRHSMAFPLMLHSGDRRDGRQPWPCVEVPIGQLWNGHTTYYAFRADQIPLETLRRIRAFHEAE